MGSIYDLFGAVKAFSIFIHWSYFQRKWSIEVFLMIRFCLSAVAFIPGPSVKYYLIRKLFTFFSCDCYPFLFCNVSKMGLFAKIVNGFQALTIFAKNSIFGNTKYKTKAIAKNYCKKFPCYLVFHARTRTISNR